MASRTDAFARPAGRRDGRLARAWRGLRFRDAVVLTSLPLLAMALLIGDALRRSAAYRGFDDWWSNAGSVATFVSDRAGALATLPGRVALRQSFDPEAADSGIIRLVVQSRDWDAMQGDPLAMWGEWVDGTLSYGRTLLDVRLRKRGDNSIHWLTDKRSLTVRTQRDEFYKRYREFGLSVKDVLPSYVANALAPEFGLLAPETAVVPVFLNNQFYGMFRFVEVVDETFLRAAGRMPGNVFRGDTAERGEAHKGTDRNLFSNPYIWDRVAVNDRPTAAPADQLDLLLRDLRGGTFDAHERLMARLDRDELARLFAFFFSVGDPYHSTGVHNQFLYEDPATQRLHPIPWDIRLRDLTRPSEAPLNDLFRAVLRDPIVTDGIMRELGRALAERRVEDAAARLVADAERRYHRYFEYDRLRAGLVPDVGTPGATLDLVSRNAATLRGWLDDDAVAFVAGGAAGAVVVVDLETRGRVGADLVAIEGLPETAGPGPVLRRDANLNGVLDADDPVVTTRRDGGALVLDAPLPLLAAWRTDDGSPAAGRMTYRLFVAGVPAGGLRPRLANRVTGEPVTLESLAAGAPMAAPTGWHPWRYPEAPNGTIRYSGEVRLTETVRVPAGVTTVIAPGTTLRLDPDVSFVSRGVVLAEGTAARPIRVVPSVPGRPWGTFSLQGPGAGGSVIRHAEFAEGGGALVDRIEYIGMVNVHGARDVVVDSTRFVRNLRSDDTFHALHADVALTNCVFEDANSDAVDYDQSSGEIRGNVFDGAGGDAIDLMTSSPRVVGNRIRGAGDKGISVGEHSAPFIFDNLIEDSVIGIEIKDRSEPVVLGNDIARAGVGLGSNLKNWRYGGSGFGLVAHTRFDHVATPLDADLASRLTTTGVAGLDPAPPAGSEAPGTPLEWLYRRFGVAVDAPAVGRPAGWRPVSAVPPVDELRFEDDFGPATDGWSGDARVTRLEKRHGVLVLEAEGGAGTIAREVSWDLSSGGGVIAVEIGGRDVARLRVEARGATATHGVDVAVPADAARFALAELPLPPDRYDRVSITLVPTPGLSQIQRSTGLSVVRAGRVSIRSVAAYPAPPSAAASAGGGRP